MEQADLVGDAAVREKAMEVLDFNVYANVATDQIRGMKIAFVVWSLDISGGTNVILNHALWLHECGARVTLLTHPNQKYPKWHRALSILEIDAIEEHRSVYDLCILTWWRTLFDLSKVRADNYLFFVQSIESRFYLANDAERGLASVVENIYSLPIPIVTVSKWMQSYLAVRHNKPSLCVSNGIDKNVFNPLIAPRLPPKKKKLRVLIEGPLNVGFKRTKELLDAIQPCRQFAEIVLVSGAKLIKTDKADYIFSQVPISEMGRVYRSCDVLAKASQVEGMFGPPLEMFHCGGTAVVTDVTGASDYMVSGYNSFVLSSEAPLEAFIEKLQILADDPRLLLQLKQGALNTARYWPDLEASSRDFAASLISVVRNYPGRGLSAISDVRSRVEQLGF